MSEFLELVKQGDIQTIKNYYDANPDAAYDRNESNLNALGLAVLSGQWKLCLILLKYCHVSPHLCDENQNSIFHLIPQGLKARRPTQSDYLEIRAENMQLWSNEEQKERSRINEIHSKNQDLKPPENLLIKKARDLEIQLFEPLDLFFAKYVLFKYKVVLNRVNHQGKHPAEVASDLGETELSRWYSHQSEPQQVKQRLVSGLNDNLVKDIASFL
jgi:hypothetical protein